MQTLVIRLEDVKMFARHGVFDFERREGNNFIVNLEVRYDAPPASVMRLDNLDNTVCYASLFEIVKKEMENPRSLLETIAFSIVENIRCSFPEIFYIECRITKLNPPIPDFCGQACVSYIWQK